MVKVKVIRGVYIKGRAYAEGAIVEVTEADYGELKSARYVEKFVEPKKDATVGIGSVSAGAQAGTMKAGK
jgi:hypothetical protein